MRFAVILITLSFGALQAGSQARSNQAAELPRSSADLVIPILDLRLQSIEACGIGETYHCKSDADFEQDEERGRKIERLVYRLTKNRTSAADRAVVFLLHYSLGPSQDEDILQSVTNRGKRTLEFLKLYRDRVPQVVGKHYPDSMLYESGLRKTKFDEAIRSVEHRVRR